MSDDRGAAIDEPAIATAMGDIVRVRAQGRETGPLPREEAFVTMETAIDIRRFESADERLDMKEHGGIDIVRLGDGTTGMYAVFEPGWTWEKDEKPLLGSPGSCPMRHKGYCLAGRLVVRMVETGVETPITKGDFFDIPPGHDAYVDGSERVELVLFEPPADPHQAP